jgi:hypothetical protein
LKIALANLNSTALDPDMLGSIITALVAYDELDAITSLIRILIACPPTTVDAAFKHIHYTLAALLGSIELAEWFAKNYTCVDE